MSAIDLAAPPAASKLSFKTSISSALLARVINDLAPTIPTNSTALFNLFVEVAEVSIVVFTVSRASSKVMPFLPSIINVLAKPVPAILPFKPPLARVPNKAVVSSKLTLVALATGPTSFKLS